MSSERIFHLALAADWEGDTKTAYETSTLGVSLAEQGFIHCSFADQVQQIADLVYRGRDDVLLLEIDPALLRAPVRVDEVDGGASFPHIYGPLNRDAVVRVIPLRLEADGRLALPHAEPVRGIEAAPLTSDPIAEADLYRAPKGTHDIIPPESGRWAALVALFAQHVERAGYGLHVPPMFEHYEVFARVGESTDIVQKEMYDFEDRGGRRLALRPEGTGSVVRAFVEHRPTLPWKVWYVAPNFRAEAPQAGRYRQHFQLGVEALGTMDPDLDVEVIALLDGFFRALGLRQYRLLLNSLGDPATRVAYLGALRSYLEEHRGDLSEQSRQTLAINPLRVLDSKRKEDAAVVAAAPRMIEHLRDEAGAHFERVQSGLHALGVEYEIAPLLVRGLDYYTRTTFEFAADSLGSAQNGIGGGGRYDGLVEQMGGPPTPGIGFGSGIERTLMACDAEGVFPARRTAVDAFVVDVVDGTHARALTSELRAAGVRADRAFDHRSMKSQMKQADRSGAALTLIVGEQEVSHGTVTVRRMADATQETVPREKVVDVVREGLS